MSTTKNKHPQAVLMTLMKKGAPLAGAVALAISQGAGAHTTFQTSSVTEGTSSYNAVVVGHTCKVDEGTDKEKQIPMTAQAVIFPTESSTGEMTDTAGATSTVTIEDLFGTGGLAGKADLVQDRNIFMKQDEIYDANKKLIGFWGSQGKLQPNLRGLVPFRFSTPSFATTAGSSTSAAGYCVKSVAVKVAVADICKLTKTPKPGDMNLWLPSVTGKFTNTEIDGIVDAEKAIAGTKYTGAPATLTISRSTDTTNNTTWKNACGSGKSLIFWPTADHIDNNLNIPDKWTPKPPKSESAK